MIQTIHHSSPVSPPPTHFEKSHRAAVWHKVLAYEMPFLSLVHELQFEGQRARHLVSWISPRSTTAWKPVYPGSTSVFNLETGNWWGIRGTKLFNGKLLGAAKFVWRFRCFATIAHGMCQGGFHTATPRDSRCLGEKS